MIVVAGLFFTHNRQRRRTERKERSKALKEEEEGQVDVSME